MALENLNNNMFPAPEKARKPPPPPAVTNALVALVIIAATLMVVGTLPAAIQVIAFSAIGGGAVVMVGVLWHAFNRAHRAPARPPYRAL